MKTTAIETCIGYAGENDTGIWPSAAMKELGVIRIYVSELEEKINRLEVVGRAILLDHMSDIRKHLAEELENALNDKYE